MICALDASKTKLRAAAHESRKHTAFSARTSTPYADTAPLIAAAATVDIAGGISSFSFFS